MHSHTFKYSDVGDFIHQIDDMKRKLLSSAPQEDMLEVRARYKMTPAQFSMRIKRFRGSLACTRLGRKIQTLFVTRELDKYLSKQKLSLPRNIKPSQINGHGYFTASTAPPGPKRGRVMSSVSSKSKTGRALRTMPGASAGEIP